ncbi:unnamed protein product [Choristocarpus tenellus]
MSSEDVARLMSDSSWTMHLDRGPKSGVEGRQKHGSGEDGDSDYEVKFMDGELTRLHQDVKRLLADAVRRGSKNSGSSEVRPKLSGDVNESDSEHEDLKESLNIDSAMLKADIDAAVKSFFAKTAHSRSHDEARLGPYRPLRKKRDRRKSRKRYFRRRSFSGVISPGDEHRFSPWDVEETLDWCNDDRYRQLRLLNNALLESEDQESMVLHQGSNSSCDTVVNLVGGRGVIESTPPELEKGRPGIIRDTLVEVNAQTSDAMNDLIELMNVWVPDAISEADPSVVCPAHGFKPLKSGSKGAEEDITVGMGVIHERVVSSGWAPAVEHVADEGAALAARMLGRLDWVNSQLDEILSGPWLDELEKKTPSECPTPDIPVGHRSSTALLCGRRWSSQMESISCGITGYRIERNVFRSDRVYFQLSITQEGTSWTVERRVDEFQGLQQALVKSFGNQAVPELDLKSNSGGGLMSDLLSIREGWRRQRTADEELAECQVHLAVWLATVLANPSLMCIPLIVFLDSGEGTPGSPGRFLSNGSRGSLRREVQAEEHDHRSRAGSSVPTHPNLEAHIVTPQKGSVSPKSGFTTPRSGSIAVPCSGSGTTGVRGRGRHLRATSPVRPFWDRRGPLGQTGKGNIGGASPSGQSPSSSWGAGAPEGAGVMLLREGSGLGEGVVVGTGVSEAGVERDEMGEHLSPSTTSPTRYLAYLDSFFNAPL